MKLCCKNCKHYLDGTCSVEENIITNIEQEFCEDWQEP